MSEDEKKMLEDFRKLSSGNRAIAQSNVSAMLAAQENTKAAMNQQNNKPAA